MKNIHVTEDQEVDSALNGVIDAAEEGFKLGKAAKKLFGKAKGGKVGDEADDGIAEPHITVDVDSLDATTHEDGTLEAYVPHTRQEMRVTFPPEITERISEDTFAVKINLDDEYMLTDGKKISCDELLKYFELKGNLVRCKVGDVLYGFPDGKTVATFRVDEILANGKDVSYTMMTADGGKFRVPKEALGKMLYRTPEKAAEAMEAAAEAVKQAAEAAKPFITVDKKSLEAEVLPDGSLEAYVPHTRREMRVSFPANSVKELSDATFKVTIDKELSYTLTDGREISGDKLLGYFEEKSRICKVGDVLYGFPDGKNITPFRVEEVLKNERTGGTLYKVSAANGAKFSISDKALGKTFFRGASKAAEALKAATVATKINPVTAAPAAVAKTAKAIRKNLTR